MVVDERLNALGAFIRERRTRLGLTQTQLAGRLGWAQERISTLEHGKYGMPSLPGLAQLAEALEVPVTSFLPVMGLVGHPCARDGAGSGQTAVLLYSLQQLLEINASSVKEALDQTSDQLAVAMNADKVDAFVYDPPTYSLVALGTSHTRLGRLERRFGLDRIPVVNHDRVADVYLTGRAFRTGDAAHDPHVSVGMKETLGVRSILATPFWMDGSVRGVLVAVSQAANHFTEDDERFLASVGQWIGMIMLRGELTEARRRSGASEAHQAAADEMITELAHELGNALTPLRGRLDLLRRALGQHGHQKEMEYADQAVHSVAEIQQLVTGLLDISRLDHGLFALERQPLDLAVLIEDVAEELRPAAGNLRVLVPRSLEVQGDAVRLREVLINLLTNAAQHTPNGAPIVLTAGTEQREDERWAVVRITDEGPGIAPDMVVRLFDRYTSGVGSSGLGIGLYLSRRLVEEHGGTLTVETATGSGATFQVALPAART